MAGPHNTCRFTFWDLQEGNCNSDHYYYHHRRRRRRYHDHRYYYYLQ
jgi:hypothetical protein